ncbi:uncharacterized protein BJ212DRAFT_1256472 [Suillus subaureus]|uniref:DUF6699 domain-containing protein n=1 Tax=Suillus subaureus TaxID=48587 RepID=A0A9P7JK74_9AGAM|nr:uncharacterized protein BJ212DRAFT_1256472 [Suillus subaureus]KAG1827499.1 hypothetical protein BJ212DRAFT_1256472 [Suillus subaureus]
MYPSICITHLCDLDTLSAHPLDTRPSPYLQVGSNQLVLYDVRKSVKEEIKEITMSGLSAMLNVGMTEIRIISKAFPWSIDIKAPAGYHVTCNSVFRALHDQLQNYITDVEWAIVAVDKTRKKAICEAANLRQKKDKDNKLKRIDWLGDMTVFKGLEEDKEFENEICLRGQMTVTGTWVARFGKKDM